MLSPYSPHRGTDVSDFNARFRAMNAFLGLENEIEDEGIRSKFHNAVANLEVQISRKSYDLKTGYRYLWNHGEYFKILHELFEENNEHIKTIRKILIKSGLAFPLWYSDWYVDRPDETHGEYTGTKPHSDICTLITERAKKAGLLDENNPTLTGLIHGPGNGYGMHELQNNTTTLKNDGSRARDHWNFVGLCDKMYFPLSGLLAKFWTGDDEMKDEFCQFLAIQIQFAVQDWKKLPENQGKLHPLQENISTLRDFLEENPNIVQEKIHNDTYSADGEFSDRTKQIRASNDLKVLAEKFQKNPSHFLENNFSQDFRGDAILENAPLFFRNIHIGDFGKFDAIFPGENLFDFISSVRGSSHVDNEAYKNLIFSSLRKLKPGGILIDDGIRRSYSRELRLKEIREIQKHLPKDYKLSLIYNADGNIRSLFAERALGDENGSPNFIDDTIIQDKILKEGHSIATIDHDKKTGEQRVKHVQEYIRTRIMKKLLEKYRHHPLYFPLLGKLGVVQKSIDTFFSEDNSFFGSKETIERTFRGVLQALGIPEAESRVTL